MIRFAICDDEEIYFNIVKEKLLKEFRDCIFHDKEIEFVFYKKSDEVIENFENDNIDIYIVDIEFGDVLGLDLARKLDKLKENVGIVYMTNYEYYVTRAFVCRPLGFIRKQHMDDDLKAAMISIVDFLSREKRYFMFYNNKAEVPLLLTKVKVINVFGHNLEVEMTDKTLKIRDKISRIDDELTRYGFVKISRSCLVNMRYIDDIQNDEIILNDKSRIPISHEKKMYVMNSWYINKMSY